MSFLKINLINESGEVLKKKDKVFTTKAEIITEIINLEAIMNLPKATEHFVSDLHGEYDAFKHILNNGSGNIRDKVITLFATELTAAEISTLCTLIYYPQEKMTELTKNLSMTSLQQWYKITIERLLHITRFTVSKYTRSKVQKAFLPEYRYILSELIYQTDADEDKKNYYNQIIIKIIELKQSELFITHLAELIKRFVVDHLHVLGDIYDRGSAPDKIIDLLMQQHSIDIQWGNHDILWLGAYAGSFACLCNVIRICARYGHLDILEKSYDINLDFLESYSHNYEATNQAFAPKLTENQTLTTTEIARTTRIHQAITILQFKAESEIINRHPEFQMQDRLLLDKINRKQATVTIKNIPYKYKNPCFQLVDEKEPYKFTEAEQHLENYLLREFKNSQKLQQHLEFLMEKGSMFLKYNGNLLFHGCIPLNETGDFQVVEIANVKYHGQALLQKYEELLRESFASPQTHDDLATDMVWYLWAGANSSLFGKDAMTTFERYFITDKTTHIETQNPYYSLRNNHQTCEKILQEFGLNQTTGHIINGHTPVKAKMGENPIKAGGKMLVIDGGFSRGYQEVTGHGGYTLLFNSYGLQLITHQPFLSLTDAINNDKDIISVKCIVDIVERRLCVKDTNIGKKLAEQEKMLQKIMKEVPKNKINND